MRQPRCGSTCLAFIIVTAAFSPLTAEEFTPPPIEVPAGFTVELVAGPPLVKYPMMAAFDEVGRLHIAESDGQNLGKEALLEQQPRFVRRIEDTDGDGKFDKSTIFADRMVMPEGALWHRNSLFILSAPYLWRLDDTDGDGVADHREPLLGEMDLIGNANQHGPYLSPAGRLLFSGGTFGYNLVPNDGGPVIKGNWASVFSCNADGSDVRVESHAGINPVEVEFTEEGEMLGTCAIFDRVGGRCDALVHWVHGGSYAERLRQPNLKSTGRYLPAALRWGQVAPAGLVRMRGGQFGDDYRGSLFACLFNTHEVIRIRVERLGATFRGEHETFLRSPSADFHPADILEDADGSLLLIDTGAWLTMGCPTSKNGQPGGFGGIYRIRKIDGAKPADPRGTELEWKEASSAELTTRLDDERPVVRDRALSALVERGDTAIPALVAAWTNQDSPRHRRQAVWTLSRIGTPAARARLCQTSLFDPDPSVRQAAVHAVGILREPTAVQALRQIVVEDELPIRREAATALGLIGAPDAVPALCDSLSTAKDEFLEHALIYALIEIGQAPGIRAWLSDENPRVQRAVLIALDQIAGDSLTREDVAPLLDTSDAELQQVALEVIARHPTWADEIVGLLREALAAKKLTPAFRAILSGTVAAFSGNEKVQLLVAETLGQVSTPPEILTALLEAIGRIEQPQLPPAWIDPLAGLLAHTDENVRRQLLASLIPFEAAPLQDSLRQMARNADEIKDLRIAALGLAVRTGSELEESELQLLITELNEDVPPAGKLAAANALATARLTPAQLQKLLPVVRRSGPLENSALLRAFAASVKHAKLSENEEREIGLKLIAALSASPGLDSLTPNRLRAVFGEFSPDVAAVARTSFPESQSAGQEQLEKISRIESQTDEGDLESGKFLFFSNRLACAGCHRINGKGGAVGPDLSQIGKVRSTRHLAEAILLPSATLANGFESYTLATHAGRTLTGLIRRESASAIHLVSPDGTETRVSRVDIAEIQPSDVSIMPQGLDKQLTQVQLRDLVAFLQSLK